MTAATRSPRTPPKSSRFFERVTLLEQGRVPIGELAGLACREGQATKPIFRVHRWFARRLGSQFRGILSALTLPAHSRRNFWNHYFNGPPLQDAVVLDPFVGGGTSLAEATRCGARGIGFDIDPVATAITRFELSAADRDGLPDGAEALMATVRSRIEALHQTELPDGRTVTVLHHFWVEFIDCAACGHEIELHPHYRLAFDAAKGLQWAFCRACGEVHETPLDDEVLVCGCGEHTPIDDAPLSSAKITCPSCAHQAALAENRTLGERPRWRLFAQEYIDGDPSAWQPPRAFKAATDADRHRYAQASARLRATEKKHGVFAPGRALPQDGRSDVRPLTYGFSAYRDFFNDRQLLHLTLLGRRIADVEDMDERRLYALAFSDHLTTNCMYTAYAFGYRRTSPLFSIHGFRHITRPVEINPWLFRVGRGTFPNALDKIRRAIEGVRAAEDLAPEGGKRASAGIVGTNADLASSDPADVIEGRARVAIATQSSTEISGVADASVDLILTDPPYFDNISYSELSDFYLAWHQVLGVAPSPYDEPGKSAPMAQNLAAADRSEAEVERYRADLTQVLSECHRVLRPQGVCVFTYHHESTTAWRLLAEALHAAGLRPSSVVPMRGEGNGGLHSYAGTIKWDAVLVCRPGRPSSAPLVLTQDDLHEARRTVRYYRRRLKAEGVQFREADALNLQRALFVSLARPSRAKKGRTPLIEALQLKLDRLPAAPVPGAARKYQNLADPFPRHRPR